MKGNSKKSKKGKPEKKWENIPIGEEFLASDKEFANLVSFEILTDYKVTREEEPKAKTEKGKKRKNDEHPSSESEEDEVEELQDQEPTESNSTSKNSKEKTITKKVKKNETTKPKLAKMKNKNTNKSALVREKAESSDEEADDTFNSSEWLKLGVPDIILKALKENSFDRPTPIQMLTLPASILGKKDVVGAAETGSGKTLAFGIPIVSGILRDKDELEESDGVQTLILTPTRELAVQIKRHIEAIANLTSVKVMVIVGGLSAQKQERILRSKPEIIIATPGRLWELIQEGNEHLSTLKQIRYLAVDETDRMVEKGHFQELQGILELLNSDEDSKNRRQNFVFSATLSFTHEPPKTFKKNSLKSKKNFKQAKKVSPQQKLKDIMEMIGVRENAKIVDITSGKGTCETLTEMSISCQLDQKDYYLYYFLIRHPGRTIVFCNSINCVRRLVNLFFLLKCETFPLHSEMNQKQRLRNLERFTANENAILIATDVAARGLDITNIEHVIHYQIPKTAESYIHRSGRTARAYKGGIAIAMMEPAETTAFWNISRSLGRTDMLPSFTVDTELYNELKGRVNMAIKVEKIEHSVRKELADMNWAEKARKDLDLAEETDEDSDDEGSHNPKKSLQKKKKQLEIMKQKLSQMLSGTPLLSKKFVNVQTTLDKMTSTKISSH